MKRGFIFACVLSLAATAAVVVYAYRQDKDVRDKIDTAVKSVSDFAGVMKDRSEQKKAQSAYEDEQARLRNQAWADQQWEALGI